MPNTEKGGARQSLTLKLVAIGVLIIIFIIPAFMVRGLVDERSNLQNDAVEEVASKWGRSQTITGPVLVVPYVKTKTVDGKILEEKQEAYFLPESLNADGSFDTQVRSRGIYDITLYEGDTKLSGHFAPVAIEKLHLNADAMRWNEAYIALGVSDLVGVKETVSLTWADTQLEMLPGARTDILSSGMHAPAPAPNTVAPTAFSATISLRGAQNLFFMPVGKETLVRIKSSWPHPSFAGAFLPADRTVSDSGFSANWRVLNLNRNFPQEWTSEQTQYHFLGGPSGKGEYYPRPVMSEYDAQYGVVTPAGDESFGVSFFVPADVYQKTTRSVKYALAVISLVFVLVFFAEIRSRRKIHPVQYVLIGLALVIYYTLLLSLSEHIGFGWGYLVASLAVALMVTLFAKSIMQETRLSLATGGVLGLFYGFTYVLVQLTDFALLMGSIALFIILGVIMYLSRQINWYGAETQ